VLLPPQKKELEEIFRSKVVVMLKRQGKIHGELIEKLMGWHREECGFLTSFIDLP
jgi:hypothetical protein